MVKTRELSVEERSLLYRQRTEGRTWKDVATRFNILMSGARKVVKNINDRQSAKTKERRGRPGVTSSRADRVIINMIKKHQHLLQKKSNHH